MVLENIFMTAQIAFKKSAGITIVNSFLGVVQRTCSNISGTTE
jgi:hypothetical protein